MSGLSILPNGLVFEYIDQNEADFLFDEIFIRNIYNITVCEPQPDSKKSRHDEASDSQFLDTNVFNNDTTVSSSIKIQLNDGDIVIDVGANIGLFSLLCQLKSNDLLIYAIEPLPPIVDVLRRNIANFKTSKLGIKSQSNVHILHFGISNATNVPVDSLDNFSDTKKDLCSREVKIEDTFYYFPSNPAESTRHLKEWKSQQDVLLNCVSSELTSSSSQPSSVAGYDYRFETLHTIQSSSLNQVGNGNAATDRSSKIQATSQMETFTSKMLSLSQMLEIYQIRSCVSLLKVDAEGDELNVLLGIGSDNNWRIIKQIVIEVHDVDGRLSQVEKLLCSKGFQVATRLQKSEISADGYLSIVPQELQLYMVYAIRHKTNE